MVLVSECVASSCTSFSIMLRRVVLGRGGSSTLRFAVAHYHGPPATSLVRYDHWFGNIIRNDAHRTVYPTFKSLRQYLRECNNFNNLSFKNSFYLTLHFSDMFDSYKEKYGSFERLPMDEIIWIGEQVLRRCDEFDEEFNQFDLKTFAQLLPKLLRFPWESQYLPSILTKFLRSVDDHNTASPFYYRHLKGQDLIILYNCLLRYELLEKYPQLEEKMYDLLVRKIGQVPFFKCFQVAACTAEYRHRVGLPFPKEVFSAFIERGMKTPLMLKSYDLSLLAVICAREGYWPHNILSFMIKKLQFLIIHEKRIRRGRKGRPFIAKLLWGFKKVRSQGVRDILDALTTEALSEWYLYDEKNARMVVEAAEVLAPSGAQYQDLLEKFQNRLLQISHGVNHKVLWFPESEQQEEKSVKSDNSTANCNRIPDEM